MDKQKRQAIGQMIVAAAICAAIVIPGMMAVNAGTEKEQAKKAEAEKAVAETIAAVKTEEEPEKEPEKIVLSYYDSIPLDKELQNYIIERSHENGIQPQIIMAIIDRESDFDAGNMGDGGNSYGLMQIQVRWHYERMQKLGCTNLLDPYHNVTVGIDYLAELLDRYDGDVAKALVAYNQGSFKGTVTNYAKAVLAEADKLGGANVYELYR